MPTYHKLLRPTNAEGMVVIKLPDSSKEVKTDIALKNVAMEVTLL